MITLKYLLLRPFRARDPNGRNLRSEAYERRVKARMASDPASAAIEGWKLFLAGGPGLKGLRRLARQPADSFFAGAVGPLRAALTAWDAEVGALADAHVVESARQIVAQADARLRDALTAVLALRLAIGYGRPGAFTGLAASRWGEGMDAGERDWAQLRLHRHVRLLGPETEALYERLLARRGRWSRPISTYWFQDMLTSGMPREALLDRTVARLDDLRLWRDGLAVRALGLALELGQEERAAAWIRGHRALGAAHEKVLAVAELMARRPDLAPRRADRAGIARRAALYHRLVEGERRLAAMVGPPTTSVAVVGNGPVELGRGRGPAIDAHDLVMRFNRYSTEPPYDADYGTRVDIVVRSVNSTPEMDACSARADLLVFCRRALLHQPHKIIALERAAADARDVAFIPTAIYDGLTPRLGALPSKGLLATAYLHALRGRLDRRDFYGFSMIDQIGVDAGSSHYFEQSTAVATYNWREEWVLFDGMFA